MAEGAPKVPVVAEAHEVDTFRESTVVHIASGTAIGVVIANRLPTRPSSENAG